MPKGGVDDLIHQSGINGNDKDKKAQQQQRIFNAAARIVFRHFVLPIPRLCRQQPDKNHTEHKTKHGEAKPDKG
ncbi:hypothetical protein SDC9_181251 [bioreactor metagenome]|uniref:Uncharacterized protein n=1 Tax=bioreactor metagenome TaxID=1076179 RepID=A0A645H4Z7_9ZZZZ